VAQVAEGDIKLGSTRIVGRLRVDAGMIRAEAGPLEPRLVIPVTIEMHNRPSDEMLALTYLIGSLHIGDQHNPATQVGLPARLELVPGMHAHSVPEGRSSHNVELRFQLNPQAVHRLETARHESAAQVFTLNLPCTGAVAWVHKTWGEMRPARGQAGATTEEDPFKLQLGMHSDLSFFWTVDIDSLRIQIEPSAWVTNVLPGLGLDTMRLVEVSFPPKLPGSGNAPRAFDEALQAFNARRYEECISKCRGLVSAWSKKFGATKTRPLADILAAHHAWPATDPRIKWLDSIWRATVDMSNEPHHPESGSIHMLDRHDARLHLMIVAALSDYLHGRS
jgi:hypothetical protein